MENSNQNENKGVERIDRVDGNAASRRQPEGPEQPEVVKTECGILEELSAKVFENDMLREIILEYVLYPNSRAFRTDMKNLRLVRKSWLQTTAISLRKFRQPMFSLNLDNYSTNLLEKFVGDMMSPIRFTDYIAPVKLTLLSSFFRKGNEPNLSDCLTACGKGLFAIHFALLKNDSTDFSFPSLHLPKLQQVSVLFCGRYFDHPPIVTPNVDAKYPLQAFLNAADELKELTFKFSTFESLPSSFENLALPRTITSLFLDCELQGLQLHLLLKNDLPCLSSLRLFAMDKPYPGETLFQILNKFRVTLQSLEFRGYRLTHRARHPTLLKFPVMENLKTLIVESEVWEPEDGLNHLETQLPKMSELRILRANESVFNKWTRSSRFDKVRAVVVSLDDKAMMTLDKMQSLHQAFPNVVNLDIELWGPQICVLKYLFLEMPSLEQLTISVYAEEPFRPDHWDSIFVGTPPEMITSFKLLLRHDLLDFAELKEHNQFPSIRNLTALKSLTLIDQISIGRTYDANKTLISDLTFYLGFLKMPNLKNLTLDRKFLASSKMAKQWEQEKRTKIHAIRKP